MSKSSASIQNKVWKFVDHADITFQTRVKGRSFSNPWLEITADGQMIVRGTNGAGYAWDGCTPKWEILDLVIGTPDGRLNYVTEKPITYYASLIHDILYQFKADVPVSRKETDLIFRDELRRASFFWTIVYFAVVRLFGGFFGKWKTR